MKRYSYKNLTSLIIVLAFCLTLLLPISIDQWVIFIKDANKTTSFIRAFLYEK